MKFLSQNDLRTYVGKSEPCVSVYVPLSGSHQENLRRLQGSLDEAFFKAREAFPALKDHFRDVPANLILESSEASRQWGAVAVFKSVFDEGFRPLAKLDEARIVVSDSFHLRPFFNLLQTESAYISIRVERGSVMVCRGSYHGEELIRTIQGRNQDSETRRIGLVPDFRTSAKTFQSAQAQRLIRMQTDRQTIKFFRNADNEIRRFIVKPDHPVILVGDQRCVTLYKNVNRHRSAVIGAIFTDGDPPISGHEVHPRCLEILEEFQRRRALRGIVEYKYTRPFGRAIDNLAAIAEAAARGQIRSLLIRSSAHIWGRISRKNGRILLNDQRATNLSDDILDDIGEMVLKNNGQVYLVRPAEMPTEAPVAAVLAQREAI